VVGTSAATRSSTPVAGVDPVSLYRVDVGPREGVVEQAVQAGPHPDADGICPGRAFEVLDVGARMLQ